MKKIKFIFSYKKYIILKHFPEFAGKYCDVSQEGSPSGTAKDRLCQTQFDVLLSECPARGSRNECIFE